MPRKTKSFVFETVLLIETNLKLWPNFTTASRGQSSMFPEVSANKCKEKVALNKSKDLQIEKILW